MSKNLDLMKVTEDFGKFNEMSKFSYGMMCFMVPANLCQNGLVSYINIKLAHDPLLLKKKGNWTDYDSCINDIVFIIAHDNMMIRHDLSTTKKIHEYYDKDYDKDIIDFVLNTLYEEPYIDEIIGYIREIEGYDK